MTAIDKNFLSEFEQKLRDAMLVDVRQLRRQAGLEPNIEAQGPAIDVMIANAVCQATSNGDFDKLEKLTAFVMELRRWENEGRR